MKPLGQLNETPQFDINGNLIIPGEKVKSEEEEWWDSAYIFRKWDEKESVYKPIIAATTFAELKEMEIKMKRDNIVIYKLFQIPQNAGSEFMEFHKNLLLLAHHHFKDVFQLQDLSQGGDRFYNSRIIIPVSVLEAIQQVIGDNSLSMYHDLILFVIAELGGLVKGRGLKDYRLNKKYKYHVANSLHQFITNVRPSSVRKGKITLNADMSCITKIMEFGLIKIGGEYIKENGKTHLIRTWVTRHNFTASQVYLETEPNFAVLRNYFELDFLNSVTTRKHVEVLKVAKAICKKFGILSLTNEICHLIACIRLKMEQVGLQLSNAGEDHPVLGQLVKLINACQLDSKGFNVTRLKEVLWQPENSIVDKGALLLINKALLNFYNYHPEEFQVDILASKITSDEETKFYNVEMLSRYQDEDKRFLPCICENLFDFFQTEIATKQTAISGQSVEFISAVLQQSHVFSGELNDEALSRKKIRNWLKNKNKIS